MVDWILRVSGETLVAIHAGIAREAIQIRSTSPASKLLLFGVRSCRGCGKKVSHHTSQDELDTDRTS
jgi:hypothetical protein